MTSPAVRSARTRRLLAAIRWGGAATAAAALAALMAIGPPSTASAASGDSYNQMTGIGSTASAVTVNWTDGLRDAQNQPITTPGSELSPNSDRQAFAAGKTTSSPLAFMYNDFKDLQVTVSQTENITHQGITVKWTGGEETDGKGSPQANFLQVMECYGDASTGPLPEDCEFGSAGMLFNPQNPEIGSRSGWLCPPDSVADPGNPPVGPAGDPAWGCDPSEPSPPDEQAAANPSHCDPAAPAGNACTDGIFAIPFVPVNDPAHPLYQQTDLLTYFSESNTNEVQDAVSNSKGAGQLQFETLTSVQAPGLGCGEIESDNQPRGCWLVVVPRGTFEPNGYTPLGHGSSAPAAYLMTSPLSASNWAQRIQIHLSYAPVPNPCPITVLPDPSVGTQLISRALSSWEFSLNQAAKCQRVYSFTATTENEATDQLASPQVGNAGLAFTTIPIGSELTRYPGGHPPALPPILYAPVAVTADDFGFNINEGSGGYDTTPVNFTPMLLAKALTQAYRADLPDYEGSVNSEPGPKWSQGNPENLTDDTAFQTLNPAVTPYHVSSIPLAPLLTLDHSALNQQVWQWIQSDPSASSWLDGGTPSSANAVAADPDYVALKLGKAPAPDSWPRAYTGKLNLGPCPITECSDENPKNPTQIILHTTDLLPAEADFDTAAALVLAANDPTETGLSWSGTNKAPDGTPGWWAANGVQPVGQIFMWALSDVPDMAAYGLIDAALCNSSGKDCVSPSIASVTTALNSATKDSAGLLEVNPVKVPSGGYPLTQVVYAAVSTTQSGTALNAYADLIAYAVGAGQTTGSNPGDLPAGYLPLPAGLRQQAMATVTKLRAIANPPTHSPTPAQSGTSPAQSGTQPATTTPAQPGTSATSTPTPAAGASATSTPGGAGAPAGTPSPQGPVVLPPSQSLVAGVTQRVSPGGIRWALVIVLLIGAGGAVGGTLLRSGRMPRFRRPREPA